MKNFAMSTAIATLMTISGATYAQTLVQDITVEADLSAIENHEAGATWANLSTDLENALAARLADKLGEDGADITIKIDTLELANSFEAAADLADSKLSGAVRISNEEPFLNDRYELAVSAGAATAYYPDDAKIETLAVDSVVFYQAMVEAFAENVALKVMEKLD